MSMDLRKRLEARSKMLNNVDVNQDVDVSQNPVNPQLAQDYVNSPAHQPMVSQSNEANIQNNPDLYARLQERSKLIGKKELSQGPIGNFINEIARKGIQLGIGTVQKATLPYDVAAFIAKKAGEAASPQEFRQNLLDDLTDMLEQKKSGKWSKEDQIRYDYMLDLVKNPEKMQEHLNVEMPNLDAGSLIEKGVKAATGVDLEPKDLAESALRWTGFIKKSPQKIINAGASAKNVKQVVKEFMPEPKEFLRGAGAAAGMQYAADAELGPIGSIAVTVIGDMLPGGVSATAKGLAHPIKTAKIIKTGSKKMLARGAASFATKEQKQLNESLIQEFRDSGVTMDLGTITSNRLVQNMQNAVAQSGLTGKALEDLKKTMTKQIVTEYKALADSLGELKIQNNYEFGKVLKEGMTEIRDADYKAIRSLYDDVRKDFGKVEVAPISLSTLVKELEDSLVSGSVKSGEQKIVLDTLNRLKSDIETNGFPKTTNVETLLNDKIGIEDIIDYEAQGGAKKLLKRVVTEINNVLKETGKENKEFAKKWKSANKKFAKHAKLYRNKITSDIFSTQYPEHLFNKMNSVSGINGVRDALSVTKKGKELFNNLARYKVEDLIGKNMVDSTSEQIKLGTFSKLLEKGQNRALISNLLTPEAYTRLTRLQKVSGKLAETAQKFLNTSRSGVHSADLAIAGKTLYDLINLISGNPWPFMRSGGILSSARLANRLMGDVEFLRMVEDAVLSSGQKSNSKLIKIGIEMAKKIRMTEEMSRRVGGAAIQTNT